MVVMTANVIRGIVDLDLDIKSYQNSYAKPEMRSEAFKKALWATVAWWWFDRDLGAAVVESILEGCERQRGLLGFLKSFYEGSF